MAPSFLSLSLFGLLGHLCLALRVVQRKASSARPLCDQALVLDACLKFSGRATVGSEALAQSLHISRASAASFLQELGLEGDEISCEVLCHRTVASLPKPQVPPSSDVGCRSSGSERVWDIDLSAEALAAIAKNSSNRIERKEAGTQRVLTSAEMKAMAAELLEVRDASFTDLQIQVANWFRIWPMIHAEATSTGGAENQEELDQLTRAYVATTLQKFAASELSSAVTKWFGDSSAATLSLVRAGVRHIQDVMMAPHYINHPNEEGYYGWVEYPYTQANNGTWPIHLGGAYFAANTANQVGTLTHEASHFYPLGTWDHVYCNIPRCLRMAQNQPEKAKENGDHFSFFIDDVVGGGMR